MKNLLCEKDEHLFLLYIYSVKWNRAEDFRWISNIYLIRICQHNISGKNNSFQNKLFGEQFYFLVKIPIHLSVLLSAYLSIYVSVFSVVGNDNFSAAFQDNRLKVLVNNSLVPLLCRSYYIRHLCIYAYKGFVNKFILSFYVLVLIFCIRFQIASRLCAGCNRSSLF